MMSEWILGVCVVMGLFGAYTAVQKDRSSVEGFIFGAAMGPFGVIAVACLPEGGSSRATTSKRSRDRDGARISDR
jgi:hypothetical protein